MDAPRENCTFVKELTPVWYSPHPYAEPQAPPSVYPLPAVKEEEGEPVSAFPITNELMLGVNTATEGVVEPAEELPVEESTPVVVAPLIS
jgi:hypothetical protein